MMRDEPETQAKTKDRQKLAGGALIASAVLAAAAGLAVAIASILRDPGLGGILRGVFGGVFLALIIVGAGAWATIWLASPRKQPDPNAGADLEASLKDLLDELERSRQETLREVNQRATMRVPLCAAGGLAVWIFGQFTDDPGDLFDAAALTIGGGVLGYLWSSFELSSRYARLYKSKVLPRLAAGFGEITWRHAVMPDMQRLRDENIFRNFDDVSADDELFGTHRGLPISIVELKLEAGSGKEKRVTFDGLLIEIELMRDTNAVTAVIADDGAFGNFRDRMRGKTRVRLEDPVFEKVYEVYGTDQIAARALLHPAFMEKLLALGQRPDFGRPLALCSGKRLTFAMPKREGRNLFEPPGFQKPAASRHGLVRLRADIEAVMAAADAVIDLDHRFEVKPLTR